MKKLLTILSLTLGLQMQAQTSRDLGNGTFMTSIKQSVK